MYFHPAVLVIILSVVELFGDISLKAYARTHDPIQLLKGILGYAGVVYILIKILRSANLMWTNGMWDGISALISTVFLYFVLGERMTSPVQYCGLILVIVGIIAMHYGGSVPYQ